MKIIYLCFSIVTLLISIPSYAMEEPEEDAKTRLSRHWNDLRGSLEELRSYLPSSREEEVENNSDPLKRWREKDVEELKIRRFYPDNHIPIQFRDNKYILRLCWEALTTKGLTETQRANICINYAVASLKLGRATDAIDYFQRALDEKNSECCFVIEGNDRLTTFYYTAEAYKDLGKYDEAIEFYDLALSGTSQLNRFTSKKIANPNILFGLAEALKKRALEVGSIEAYKKVLDLKDRGGRVMVGGHDRVKIYLLLANILTDENLSCEAVIYYHKAINARNEKGCFLLEGEKREETLSRLMSTLTSSGQAGSHEVYTLAGNTKNEKGVFAYSDYDQKRILKKKVETEKSRKNLFCIQMPANRKRKLPLSCDQGTKKDEKTKSMDSRPEESAAYLIDRIKNALKAAGDLKIALRNCDELLKRQNLMSEEDYGSALELKLTVLQKLVKVSQGEVKKKMQKEAEELGNLLSELQESPESSRMGINFLLSGEKPPLKKSRLQSDEASNP
ncbi:MAG: hypothetical protein BGO67_09465 [Alphaproteobacteria bacterium 41-28]|nr:MAG: hypothetical protein BGO67_09465 [Alphaproteobacteria bacterium 41-28]